MPDLRNVARRVPGDADGELPKATLADIVRGHLDRKWKFFVRWAPTLRRFMSNEFRALHLAIFYFLGAYYNIANRILRIRYVGFDGLALCELKLPNTFWFRFSRDS